MGGGPAGVGREVNKPPYRLFGVATHKAPTIFME